jgi:rare lipoprotein A
MLSCRTVILGLSLSIAVVLLAACTSSPESVESTDAAADPVPFAEPPSRLGNPMVYTVFGEEYRVVSSSEGYREHGLASWYGRQFHGKPTSSGLPYDMYAQTAAHKTLPIPTFVRVTRLDNGRSIIVRVNDRGPFVADRIIDLSYAAARKLGMTEEGLTQVEVKALPPYQYLAWHADPAIQNAQPLSASASATPARSPRREQFLQVGAFSQRQAAEHLRQRLSARLGSGVEIANSADALYRVRIGPLRGPEDVDRLRLALVEFGIDTIYLTQD